MGNRPSKWTQFHYPEYAFRHEPSHVIGLNLDHFWDELPLNYKYLVMREVYMKNARVHSWVDTLYAKRMAFAVLANEGEKGLYVSHSIRLDVDEFTYIMLLSSPKNYESMVGLLESSANLTTHAFKQEVENESETVETDPAPDLSHFTSV